MNKNEIILYKTQDRDITIDVLDVIISVGYRVKSKRGTEFRIWATQRLKDYIIKGYAINDRLKIEQYNDLKQTIKLLYDKRNKYKII